MKRFIAAFSIAALAGAALAAQETRSATLLTTEHYLDWERVSDAQISPDGSRIVYTRQHVNKLEDKWDSELWILNADGSQQRFLVKGGAPRWSPDGKRLLYQAEGEPKGSQLFVRWVDAEGPATQITHIGEAPRNAKWSPDSKSIVFDGNRSPDADMQYETSQIYVADAATGAIRDLVTKAGEWVKPMVSPDGRTVAFTGYAPTGHSHTVSDMWVVPISGGS